MLRSLRCRSGRCWTRGLHSVPVVAGRVPPARSNTGTQQHRRLATCSYFGVIICAYTGSSKLAPVPAHLIAFIVNLHAALRAAPLRMKARWFRACGTPPSADGIRALRSACGMSTLPLRSVLDKRHWRLAPRAHTVLSANVRASGQASLPVCASACRAFIVNGHAAVRRHHYK